MVKLIYIIVLTLLLINPILAQYPSFRTDSSQNVEFDEIEVNKLAS